jgi:Reverse transcriptase (RNA-dependent DNA polymerase)
VINGWYSKQIDYVLAFPQADSMSIPKGFEMTKGVSPKDYVLHIRKNVYGQKQGSRVWHQHLNKKLEVAGLKQSQIDDRVYTHKRLIYILYMDDSILVGPDEQELVKITNRIQATGLEITGKGTIEDFLGVRIERDEREGTVTLRQPYLIESILQDLRLNGDQVAMKGTPAKTSDIL